MHGNKENDHQQHNLISLTFIVNGKETIVEKVNVNQPLQVSVEKALTQTGQSGRPVTDWLVKWNDQDLNVSQKVDDFNFTREAKIFLSLRSGQGGKY